MQQVPSKGATEQLQQRRNNYLESSCQHESCFGGCRGIVEEGVTLQEHRKAADSNSTV